MGGCLSRRRETAEVPSPVIDDVQLNRLREHVLMYREHIKRRSSEEATRNTYSTSSMWKPIDISDLDNICRQSESDRN